MKEKHVIDPFKALTAPVVLILMAIFDQWDNLTAWIYLAIHGTYGYLWVFKSYMFPDKSWEVEATLFRRFWLASGLIGYWIAPFLLCYYEYHAPNWMLAVIISIRGFGIFWHFIADMQKYISLNLNPGKLFTNSVWAKVRNPNYFAEFLIYLSYAFLSGHWFQFVFLGLEWLWNGFRICAKKKNHYPDTKNSMIG